MTSTVTSVGSSSSILDTKGEERTNEPANEDHGSSLLADEEHSTKKSRFN